MSTVFSCVKVKSKFIDNKYVSKAVEMDFNYCSRTDLYYVGILLMMTNHYQM